MRLITFKAPTQQEAMRRLRVEAGPDVMLLRSEEGADGVEVTAAVDAAEDDLGALLAPAEAGRMREEVMAALLRHKVPAPVCTAIENELGSVPWGDSTGLLAGALARRFRFAAINDSFSGAAALVGPAGAGKTAAVARLAAVAKLADREVVVASIDRGRAGGLEQLQALIAPLRLKPVVPSTPGELRVLVERHAQRGLLLIDTMGVNAFRGSELANAAEWLSGSGARPTLVLPAGLDVQDSLEIAARFGALGAQRMMVTRLDAARRMGAILAVADAGYTVAEASYSPLIGQPMLPLNPTGLSRLLLRPIGGETAD